MKRYLILGRKGADGFRGTVEMVEHKHGEWVSIEDVEKLVAELTRLKELNREMVELVKRIDLDVDDLIVGNVNMIAWAKRSLEISQTLSRVRVQGG